MEPEGREMNTLRASRRERQETLGVGGWGGVGGHRASRKVEAGGSGEVGVPHGFQGPGAHLPSPPALSGVFHKAEGTFSPSTSDPVPQRSFPPFGARREETLRRSPRGSLAAPAARLPEVCVWRQEVYSWELTPE